MRSFTAGLQGGFWPDVYSNCPIRDAAMRRSSRCALRVAWRCFQLPRLHSVSDAQVRALQRCARERSRGTAPEDSCRAEPHSTGCRAAGICTKAEMKGALCEAAAAWAHARKCRSAWALPHRWRRRQVAAECISRSPCQPGLLPSSLEFMILPWLPSACALPDA